MKIKELITRLQELAQVNPGLDVTVHTYDDLVAVREVVADYDADPPSIVIILEA